MNRYIKYAMLNLMVFLALFVNVVAQDAQTVSLRSGWNLFSTYIIPDTANPADLFAPVITQGMIIKDSNGQIFWGYYGVNQIGNIVAGNGYSLKLESNYSLNITGQMIDPAFYALAIPVGWTYLGYVRKYPSLTENMLTNLSYYLLKDEDGMVNWPDFGISQVNMLWPGKAYQVRVDSAQQFFYPDNTYMCGIDLLLDEDGNNYKSVQIDSACWMAQNLNSGVMLVSQMSPANNGLIEKYCYDNIANNCDSFGGLYSWNELMNYQSQAGSKGICPENWHVPSDSDWKSLEISLGMDSLYLEVFGWRGLTVGTELLIGGSSGFEALLSGSFIPNQSFYGSYYIGNFYTSSVFTGNNAIFRQVGYSNTGIKRYFGAKSFAFSVRCVQDESDTCLTIPTLANAGADQIGLITNTTVLAANIPLEGTGIWTLLSGSGGFLSNPAMPTSGFSGVGGNNYLIEWSISTACDISRDTVLITLSSIGNSCGQVFIDVRDGQAYHTVQIGSQCWMSDNLNFGTQISCLCNQFDDNTVEKYCYDNTGAYCDSLGGMYQWGELMDYDTMPGVTGICPAGWHIPSDAEYQSMEASLGMSNTELNIMNDWRGTNEGTQLKEGGSSGFNGQLAGRRVSGVFSVLNEFGYFWTSDQDGIHGVARSLRAIDGKVGRYNVYPKFFGLPVRCVKDGQ